MATGRRDTVVFTVVVTGLVGLCAAAMVVFIALSGAPSSYALAMVLAALPVGPLVACYLWLDRYEPEPRALLALGLAWGAAVATVLALALHGIAALGGVGTRESLTFGAPLVEEATKGAFLVVLLWWRRHELDGVLDAVVYAGMVGIGFAFTENIIYLAAAYAGSPGFGEGGAEALTATFLVRCIASPFAHPLFTTFTGIGVGIAVSSRRPVVRFAAPVVGYTLAVGTHALWNAATLRGVEGFVGMYLGLMLPVLVALTALALWMRRSERQLLLVALVDAARRGLIPYSDIGWVVDLRARRASRAFARQCGGAPAERAMRDYQQAAVELGFLHHRYLRGTAPEDFAERGRELVSRLHAVRPYVDFPRQPVPAR